MSVFDLEAVPQIVVMNPRGNTGAFESPLIASATTRSRGGYKWLIVYTYTELKGDPRADLMGTLVALRGMENRLRVPIYDNPMRGAYGGTPLVDGGSQTGSSIDLKGCSNSITNWIRKGDYFSVYVNSEHELKMATADASSNGTGLITIAFEPRLRAAPANNAVVFVEDGVLAKPRGIFYLTNPDTNWSSRPAVDGRSAFSVAMTEDVFATQ